MLFPSLADGVKMTVSGTPGTGTITLGSAVSGFQSLSGASVANGAVLPCYITDVSNAWEFSFCTYNSSAGTLTRQVVWSSNSNAAVSLTSAAIVNVTIFAENLNDFASGMRGHIAGMNLSNDATTPNSVIDISTGSCTSDDATTMIAFASAITKSIASTWSLGSGNGGLDTGSVLASTWYHVYAIERVDTGVCDALISQAPGIGATSVTCTSASPAVFTWNGGAALPFQNGCPIVLGGTTVPAGFTAGTTYYVVSATQASGTFELSATQGGSAINSTSAGTAVTASAGPVLPTNYTKKRRIGSIFVNSSSNILAFSQNGDEFLFSAQFQDFSGSLSSSSALIALAHVPIGVKVNALFSLANNGTTSGEALITSPDQGTPTVNTPTGNYQIIGTSGYAFGTVPLNARTNISQQIRGTGSGTFACIIITFGYIDTRGRFS